MRVNDRVNLILQGDQEKGIPPNPTLAAFAYNKIWREEAKEDEPTPIYYGRRRRRGWRG